MKLILMALAIIGLGNAQFHVEIRETNHYKVRQSCRADRGYMDTVFANDRVRCAITCDLHPSCVAATLTEHGPVNVNVQCDFFDRINENLDNLDCGHEDSRFICKFSVNLLEGEFEKNYVAFTVDEHILNPLCSRGCFMYMYSYCLSISHRLGQRMPGDHS